MQAHWPLLLALPGLVLGSYVATAALRGAQGESAARGRSRCDGCGASLGFAETVPLGSYLVLKGACGRCGGRIDPLHPVGELAGAALLPLAFYAAPPAAAAVIVAVGLCLLAAAIVDARTQRLPDALTAAVAVGGGALAALAGPGAMLGGAIAAVLTGGLLLVVRALVRGGGAPGLGLGDVKLAAALALWLGADTPVAVAAAAVLGLAVAPRLKDARGRLPFGPMLAAAGWTVGLLGMAEVRPWAL